MLRWQRWFMLLLQRLCQLLEPLRFYLIFFFFQAEDGIRDYKVTGVQTCALPISRSGSRAIVRRGSGPQAWRERGGSMQQAPIDTAEATVDVAVAPEAVWRMVSDLTRVGEWSPENRGGKWLGGATGAELGARFKGANRRGIAMWSTFCTIVRLEPERAIAWEVRAPWGGPALSRWTYELEPTRDGTRVTERWELLKASPVTKATWVLIAGTPASRVAMLKASLAQSLGKLKTVLERDAVGATGAGQA